VPPSPWPYLDHPGILAFAHRGGAGVAPENTLPAFAAAVDMGFRYLETDVHLSRDGVLVAFHDEVLDRVSDGTGRIGDLPWSAIAEVRVGGHPIPRLDELLEHLPGAHVNIDPKHDGAVEPLADLLLRMGAVERVGIGSFSDRRLARMRQRCGPRLCTSTGPVGVSRLLLANRGVPIGRLGSACAQVPVRRKGLTIVDERFVRTAHRRGLQVHVWTVDTAAEMEHLLDLGVDGLMTDHPAILKQVLEARGLWV
jgi:glycerophosphoryl diester phosphodiesterase